MSNLSSQPVLVIKTVLNSPTVSFPTNFRDSLGLEIVLGTVQTLGWEGAQVKKKATPLIPFFQVYH